jgi:hypothetical protein
LLVFVLSCTGALAADSRTELVSIGPGGASVDSAEFLAASDDGTKAFFATGEALVPEDADGLCPRGFDPDTGEPNPPTPCVDIYERDLVAATTKLVSIGPAGASGHFEPGFAGASRDGTHVFFETREPLTSEDTDSGCIDDENETVPCTDVYERTGDRTNLVSTGPAGGNGKFDAKFDAVSADGSRAFFFTREKLTSDANAFGGIYERSGGATTFVAPGNFDAISSDGRRVFFDTSGALVSEDTDSCSGGFGCHDVYERDIESGTTRLISTGPQPNQPYDADFAGVTPDGEHVFFVTQESLVAEDGVPDEPGCADVYERFRDETTLISTGPKRAGLDACFGGSGLPRFTPDGSQVFFASAEQLVDEDTDASTDIYERTGGTTTLLSIGPAGGNGASAAVFWGASDDGSHIFIGTSERLLTEDTNDEFEIYERSGGTLGLVFTGPNGQFRASQIGASPDGGFFFETNERLVPEDPDSSADAYERLGGQIKLISKGPTGASSRFVPFGFDEFRSVADGGRRFFFAAYGRLTSDDTDNSRDIYVAIRNQAPTCTSVTPSTSVLLPANGKLRQVSLGGASDPDGDPVHLEITGVTQDERVGSTPDALHGAGPSEVLLRAERALKGDGRVYLIAFEASDDEGGTCEGTVRVAVPRHKQRAAVDSAPPSYDSFAEQ